MADVEFTVVFLGHPRNIKGNPFDLVTEFGKVVTIGVGNSFEEADKFREALEKIAELHGLGKEFEIAQAALDENNEATTAVLEAGRTA